MQFGYFRRMTEHLKYLFFLVCTLFFLNGSAQTAFSSAGAGSVSASGSVDFTLGQVAFTTAISTQRSIQLGVQQAYTDGESAVSSREAHSLLSLYPNPARSFATLEYARFDEVASIALFDATGRLAQRMTMPSSSLNINLERYASGVYIVELTRLDSQKIRLRLIIQS